MMIPTAISGTIGNLRRHNVDLVAAAVIGVAACTTTALGAWLATLVDPFTANVLFAVEAQRRWGHEGITVNALMPGGIWTGLQKHWDPEVLADLKRTAGDVVKTTEQGAATSVFLAAHPQVAGIGGRYFEDCQEAEVVPQLRGLSGVLPHALDPVAARRLWDVSEELLAQARAAA